MAFSRRMMMFGLAGTATTGAVSVPLFMNVEQFKQRLRPVGKGRRGIPLASATFDDWSLQKGSLFTVDSGQVLELVEVRAFQEHPGRPRNLRQKAFVSSFEVKRGDPLSESRIYRMSHNEGGAFDLLLTHAAPEKPLRMLAIMN